MSPEDPVQRPSWDIFISYASEDRTAVADPLARGLAERGYPIEFDERFIMSGAAWHALHQTAVAQLWAAARERSPLSRSLSGDDVGIRLIATSLVALAAVSECVVGRGLSDQVLRTVSGSTTTVTEFERVVDGAMRRAGVAGLSVAIVNDRKVVYTRQFGWRDKGSGSRLDDTTVFAAASLSKTVFAHLTLLLAPNAQNPAIHREPPSTACLLVPR
jgi:hypothetical protein